MGILKNLLQPKVVYLLWSGLKLLLLESMAILASYKISNYKRVGQSILDSIFWIA